MKPFSWCNLFFCFHGASTGVLILYLGVVSGLLVAALVTVVAVAINHMTSGLSE